MEEFLNGLADMVEEFGTAPTIEEMPRRTLGDKGIYGPTAAHVIEEIHTPLNLAFVTFTTGSSAFQNVIGVTHQELPGRAQAARRVLEQAGIAPGSTVLFTYPPLVNVFTRQALAEYGIDWLFLRRSSRDAFLAALYNRRPQAIIGESSFLRAALEDAKSMGIGACLPRRPIILAAGTPLDPELAPVAKDILGGAVHDLYGCQEFGWLTLDGTPVRDDISLIRTPSTAKTYYEFVVGGLPMGDSFTVAESGHVLNPAGKIITYRRERSYPEYEVVIRATTLSSPLTAARVARTILRIKGRIVKVDPNIQTNAPATVLELRPECGADRSGPVIIAGPEKTRLFDDLVRAQLDYQQTAKTDPTWIKRR